MVSRRNLPVKIIGFKSIHPGYVYFLSYDDVLLRVLGACDEALKEAAFRSTSRGPTEDALIAAAMELDEYGREFHEPK